jgi:hypothetical protein
MITQFTKPPLLAPLGAESCAMIGTEDHSMLEGVASIRMFQVLERHNR